MLGLIVVAPSGGEGLPPDALVEDLVGVSVMARAIAAVLPADEPVTGVLVVPEAMIDDVKANIIDRFGFDEIENVVAGGPSMVDAVRAGLAVLGDDVDVVIIQHAAAPLVPVGMVERVVAAARQGDAATGASTLRGFIVAEEDGGMVPLDVRPRLRMVQSPQAVKRETLQAALEHGAGSADDIAAVVGDAGGNVTLVDGDVDNLLLHDAADLSRAIEVFARRAIDFAFVYPRDLLPTDPLRAALDAEREANAQSSDDGNGASSA